MQTNHPFRVGDQCVSVTLTELLALSKRARELSMAALSKSTHNGQRHSRLLARGMEFAESRHYQTGDDIRNIDWRVTARTGKAHTKLFTAEKERQVLLSVDMRSSMFFATKGVFKSVQAALMAGYLAWNSTQKGDRLGGVIFDDQSVQEWRPALRKKGVLPLLHCLAEHSDYFAKKNTTLTSKESVLDEAIASLRQMSTPGSLVLLISDFRHLTSLGRDLLFQISRHSDVCLVFMFDTLEASLPKNGYFPVTNGHHEVQLNTYDKKSLERYQQQFIERRAKVTALAEQRHVHFIECSTQDDCLEILKNAF